ncbi:MAG: helix-turn-helix domain-containing protein [Spirochaetia bacterium]|nr:helix-turn-helix domain-containing protein [Spirochaetia bacterium]
MSQNLTFESWLEKWLSLRETIHFTDFFGNTTVWPDWTTGDRILPEHLIYLVTRETMSGKVAGKSLRIGPGSFLWVPAGVRHHLRVEGKSPFSVKFFRFGFSDPQKHLCPKWPALILPEAWGLLPIVEEIIRLHAKQTPFREIELRSLVALLLSRAKNPGRRENVGRDGLDSKSLEKLEALVEKNISGRLSPAELARHLRLTPDYFSRIFHRSMGRSPKRWLVEKRIHRAHLLLDESELKVAEVSERLGYSDLRLFTKQYKSVFGQSPRKK